MFLALLLLAAVVPASVAAAWPRGDLRMWVERRHAERGPYGLAQGWDGWVTHLDGRLYPVNVGAWSLWADFAERGQDIRLTASDVPTSFGRMSLRLGDYTLEDDPAVGPGQEFRRPIWLRGAACALTRGDLAVELRGGSLTERRGFSGLGLVPTDALVLGAAVSRGRGDGRRWELSWDRQDGSAAGTRGLQESRFLFQAEAARGWSWLGDLRVSREEGSVRAGTSGLTGLSHRSEWTVVSAHLRRIDPGYREIGLLRPAHENEWGARVEGHLRTRSSVFAGIAGDWARDLSGRADGLPPEERVSARVHVSAPIFGSFYAQAGTGYRRRSTIDPDSLLVDQGAWTGSAEIGWRRPQHGGSLGYTRGMFRDPTEESGDWHEDRVTARLSRRLGRGPRVELIGTAAERRLPDGRWTSRERRVESRLAWDPSDSRSLWLDLARERQEADQGIYAHDQWELGGGIRQEILRDFMLGIDGTATFRAGAGRAEAGRLNIRLSRSLSFAGGRLGAAEDLPEYGSVRGEVFDDRNGNGSRDDGEPGIPGLVLRLGSGEEAITSASGSYRLERAVPALDYLLFDPARLPARYLPPLLDRIALRLRPGENAVANFPIRRSAGVSGRVAVRADDGTLIGVPDVLVALRGGYQDAFTGPDGRFSLTGLEPGPAVLDIVEWTLPHGARLSGAAVRELRLEAGETATALPFLLERLEPQVRQVFRPGTH